MYYVLVINAAVSLIMGCALVLVWRRDRAQSFTLYIGWANLVQLLVPLAYLLRSQGQGVYAAAGGIALAVVAAVYSTLLADRHLASGQSTDSQRPVVAGVGTWLVLVNATAIALGGLRTGQTCMALVNTGLGLVCTYWLLSASAVRSTSEKLVGPLLVSLGLIQFIFVVYGDAGATLLATLGAILRLTLGLVLLYAALDRGAAAALKLKKRFEQLTERSHQAIMISFGDSSIVYANPACLALYGVSSLEQFAGGHGRTHDSQRGQVKRAVSRSEIHGQASDASYDALRYRADGTPMWLRCHYFRTEWDGAHAVQVLISDDTARHKANEALLHQAMHDELTGLPNRAAMIRSLHKRCEPAEPNSALLLVLMNIDRFKLFNEAHGHSMGDEVLRAMGQVLRATMDSDCEVMRLAGDEFALVSAPNGSGDTAVEMVTRIRNLLVNPLQVSGQEFFLDASIGIALYPNSARDAESLLRAANAAMHVAKRTPGNGTGWQKRNSSAVPVTRWSKSRRFARVLTAGSLNWCTSPRSTPIRAA